MKLFWILLDIFWNLILLINLRFLVPSFFSKKAGWARGLLLCVCPLFAQEGDYRIEGAFASVGERRTFLTSFFLPYNPLILFVGPDIKEDNPCKSFWQAAKVLELSQVDFSSPPLFDLLWIEKGDSQQILYQDLRPLINGASAIYATTDLSHRGIHFQNLQLFLELYGFTLLTHWYFEKQSGHALFVKQQIYDATIRSLNYTPSKQTPSAWINSSGRLERFFKRAENKAPYHFMDEIDFIYMINLDERPEKFTASTQQLAPFGISPYRFSAVNGWKLPFAIFDEVGVKFPSGTLNDKFRGTIFRKEGNSEFSSNEFLQEQAGAYFALGLSRGAIGITLSHLSILQDAYDCRHQTVWVMEDDVQVVGNPQTLPHLIRHLTQIAPDWDILFTDRDTKDSQGNRIPCRALAARPNYPIPPLSSFLAKFYPVNVEFSRIGMRYGAYSMILRRSGIEKILNFFKKYQIFLPYDLDFWLIPDLNMYVVNEDIVSHLPGAPSDNAYPTYNK